ncbi:MAG TPA: MauE/DoxX family redox-associated membrane protein, partial [Micromonosporaceae bacterium]
VPDRLVVPVAAVVVGAETLIALGLAAAVVSTLAGLDVGRPLALAMLLAATGLLAVLTAGVGMTLKQGVVGQCRCFGGEERPLSVVHLVRNGVLVLIAIGGAGFSLVAATPEPAGAVVGLVAGGVTALVLVRLDDLVELFGPVRDRSAGSLPRS